MFGKQLLVAFEVKMETFMEKKCGRAKDHKNKQYENKDASETISEDISKMITNCKTIEASEKVFALEGAGICKEDDVKPGVQCLL